MTADAGHARRTYPSVADAFRGKDVLITGATGFLGKVIVEKLLRCCPDVGTLHVLMRPKKGQEVHRRLEDYVNLELFSGVRTAAGGAAALAKRLRVARGDVTMLDLGLSPEDRALLAKNVRIILHCAANVRFDMTLRQALTCNTRGTHRVLQLAEEIADLEAFVHVSTAYCHCDLPEVQEKLYPARADPEKTLKLLDWMSDDMLEALAPKLLAGLPNTYALSKNLSEGLVQNYAGKFPIGIARPSIVTSMWKEPLPGWVDNVNGPTGLMLGAGKGVIRSMHCKAYYHADVVPVDMAANAVISLAWRVANEKSKEIDVVNTTCWKDNLVTWQEVIDSGRANLYKTPFSDAVWYPDGTIKSSKLMHTLCVVFFHFLPAYFIDFLLLLCGRKPFMVRVQRRIQGGLAALQYYTTKEWHFPNLRMHELHKQLPPDDQKCYFWGVQLVELNQYTADIVLGTRHYFLKDKPETLPKARRHLKMLYVIDRLVALIFYSCLLWLLWSWAPSVVAGVESALGAVVSAISPVRVAAADADADAADAFVDSVAS